MKMKIGLLLFVVLQTLVYSQSKDDFADYLMQNRDYFRAISALKESYYFSNDSIQKKENLINISKAYSLGEKYNLSNSYADHIIENYKVENNTIAMLHNLRGINYYKLALPDVAEDCFEQSYLSIPNDIARFYSGIIRIEKADWKEASKIYDGLSQSENEQISFLSKKLYKKSLAYEYIPQKSPLLASIFSAVLPGLGQVYSKHYYDGIQAFLYCIITSYAAYASYRYDKHFNDNYVTTYITVPLAATFYLANIFGANLTANYHNMKMRQNYLDSFGKLVFSVGIN